MRFQTISNSIAHDNVSTVPAIIKDLYGLQRGLQGISNSIAHDNASTVSATIIDSYGPGVGNAYFFPKVSNSIGRDNASTLSAIITDSMVLEWVMRTFAWISNSSVHDSVSTISAMVIDIGTPGVDHVYFCKTISLPSSMTM